MAFFRGTLALAIISATALCAPRVRAQEKKVFEVNTLLMESTFMIEGQNAQGQSVRGTAFLMGRPFPNNPNKFRHVLVTAAHVLEEMQGVQPQISWTLN